MYKTIIEPFRIKTIEPIKMTTQAQRQSILKNAHYNLFLIKAEDVMIDFLTDSGTGAMSSAQWAAMMEGDESYAGSRSYYAFEKVVSDLTGFKHIFPTHQGRAAERILFSVIGGPDKFIPNNTHFDTTRANIEHTHTTAVDLMPESSKDTRTYAPFKGNMDVEKLKQFIDETGADKIPLCMLTVTNNSGGGQPVSMQNIKEVRAVCTQYNIPLFLDACRFAENAYFIKLREEGYANKSIEAIAKEMFSYADGCTMSAKKDGMVNMGGFLTCNDDSLAEKFQELEILTEGFPTYGGLSGRDLGALAQGLKEVLEEDYLQYRIQSTQYLGNGLKAAGIPIVEPTGGHAVYIDAKAFLPEIPAHHLPAQSVANALYILGGIRGVEIGTLMFGRPNPKTGIDTPAPMELVRLAIPRRMYTQSHVDYVIEVAHELVKQKNSLQGYTITEQAKSLRHFSAKLAPLS
ncbi:MAG TPA: tryptophanase [Oligoflexia bacterium]|nr:tryptophanase [Oligoflexia bacterium]HMR25650.1 tryptophanase [Oligoflexia bacterium]